MSTSKAWRKAHETLNTFTETKQAANNAWHTWQSSNPNNEWDSFTKWESLSKSLESARQQWILAAFALLAELFDKDVDDINFL